VTEAEMVTGPGVVHGPPIPVPLPEAVPLKIV
jgi:hypothetical protein